MQRGLTIDQVANDTRISSRFLEALEDEAFEELPAPVYVRGFLRSYANYLHIDAQPLLDQLNAGPGAPAGGPDAFVGGPVPRQPAGRKAVPPRRGAATNPFQRSAPAPRPAPNRASVPPPAAFEDEGELYPDEAPPGNGWAPESDPQAIDDFAPSHRGAYGGVAPAAFEAGYDEDAGGRVRQRGVSGILLERDDAGGQSSTPSRILVIAAGALLALLVAVAAVVALTRGGDNGAGAPASSGTPGRTPGTVIVVGASSPTPATSASPAAAASASPGATAGTTTPVTTPTAAGATTPTSIPATPLPTATPSPTTVPATPTATRVPPTPTPIPPTVQPHPQGFAECVANNGDCTSADGLIHVVCAPNGWFVDIATVPGQHSWPWTVHTVSPPNSNAQTACP